MLNENVPLPRNSENKTDVENGFVHTIGVETGPDLPKQSEVMNKQNEDLTINQTFETSRDCETETLLPNKETQSDNDVGSDTCNSDNKKDPPFYPTNIPVVKSRICRPKGTNKPILEFSKSERPLSLKKKIRENVKTMRLVRKFREPMM